MRKLKLQPRRRQIAAIITIALITGFISVSALVLGFAKQAMLSQIDHAYAGADIIVNPQQVIENKSTANDPYTEADVIADINNIEGVEYAYQISVHMPSVVLDEPEAPQDPNLVFGLGKYATYAVDRPESNLNLLAGSKPGDGEILIDSSLAKANEISVGDPLYLYTLDTQEVNELTVSGISDPLMWQIFTPQMYQLHVNSNTFEDLKGERSFVVVGENGEEQIIHLSSSIGVKTSDSTTIEQLRENLKAAGYQDLKLGSETVAEQIEAIGIAFTAVAVFLMAFIAVAMVTSILVVSNSFAVTIAQRRRSFALARALGASNFQTISRVVYDSLVVGLIGSIVGVVGAHLLVTAGMLIARNLYSPAVPATPGFYLNATVLPLFTGIVLALLASVLPALSLVALKPLEALRPAEATKGKRASLLRIISSTLIIVLGGGILGTALLLTAGKNQPEALPVLMGVLSGGIIAVGLVGVMPALVKPFAWLFQILTSPLRSVSAKFAALNSNRNPKRSATTASAVMIAAALMTVMTTGAATAEQTLISDLTKRKPIDFVLVAHSIDSDIINQLQNAQGVDKVAKVSTAIVPLTEGNPLTIFAPTPEQLDEVSRFENLSAAVEPDTLLLGQQLANAHALEDQEVIKIPNQLGEIVELKVKIFGNLDMALVDEATIGELTKGSVPGENQASGNDQQSLDTLQSVESALVKIHDPNHSSRQNLNAEAVGAKLLSITDQLPPTQVIDTDYEAAELELYSNMINSMLISTYVLLAVAVLVALVGIANTLSLSVVERSGENALLRALGTSKRQLQSMLAFEGVLIAILGTIIGAVSGVILGLSGVKLIIAESTEFVAVIPWGHLMLVAAAATLAALLASLVPGKIAANTQPALALAQRDE